MQRERPLQQVYFLTVHTNWKNALHADELPVSRYTWVRLMAAQTGVGGDDSWGAPVHEEYRIPASKPLKLHFRLRRSEREKLVSVHLWDW